MRAIVLLTLIIAGLSNQGHTEPTPEKFRVFADHYQFTNFMRRVQIQDLNVDVGIFSMREGVQPGGGEVVGRSAQYIGPARVDGTWIQSIYSGTGQVKYAVGKVLANPPRHLRVSAEILARNPEVAERILLTRVPEAKLAVRILPPEVVISWNALRGEFLPYWLIKYVPKTEDAVYFARISAAGELIERGKLDVSGSDGLARVFPKGPNLSSLSEEKLFNLTGDGSLNSRSIRLSSALNLNLYSPNQIFFYDTAQPQFEAVQAYYSVDNALAWFKGKLGAFLKNPLQVHVHVGENGVSNAAFYHENQIYLGRGDGVLYRDMLKDPTVVMHETAHAIIDQYVALPTTGEGGSLNEGFADLFTALILDHPDMGDVSWIKGPYRRTVKNDLKAYRDFTSGVYRNGSVIAGTFWDIRERFGIETTAQIAFRTLTRLGSGAGFDDFSSAIIFAAASLLSAEDLDSVAKILTARGWRVIDGN